MTHSDISEIARDRLELLNKNYLVDAVKECVFLNNKSSQQADIFAEISNNIKSNDEIKYFAEATISKKDDPETYARYRLKNGFATGGIKIDLNTPPKWDEYKSATRNIRYKLHSWVMLDTLLTADEVSSDDEFINIAINIAYDWITKYVINMEKDEFAWYDMAVGQRATKLPYLIHRMVELGTQPDKIFKFIIASEIHLIELSQKERIAFHSNHGLFQIAGLMAIVNGLPWLKRSDKSSKISIDYLKIMLNEHFSKDGLHKEHSPEYHLFMINHLSAFLESGWLDGYDEIKYLTKSVKESSYWMQTPNNEIISMGDSKNNLPIIERWHSASSELRLGLKNFLEGGLVIHNAKKNGFSQLVYSCQFHSRQHKHADHHNFTYHANGRPLLVDAGTYTYQYDLPERIYCESTRAHNTVEIDGLNYSRFLKDKFGSGIQIAEEIGPIVLIRGLVNHKRLISSFIPNNKIKMDDGKPVNIQHKRTLIHFPSRFLAIIDELDSPDDHQYIQWNHFAPDLEIRKYTSNKFGLHDNKEKVVSRIYIKGDESTNLTDLLIKGQTQPHLQGWFSKEGIELVENYALGFTSSGKKSKFVTVIDTKVGVTGKPYFRTGSNGKYLRFALTQDGEKFDIKFRENESKINIEIIFGDEAIVHEIDKIDEG